MGGNIVWARNSTGTVYVFNLDDGFVVDDGGNFSLYVDPTFDVTQGGSISNTGTADNPRFDYSLNLSVTAFAIDGSGAGTTASTKFNLGSTITKNNLLNLISINTNKIKELRDLYFKKREALVVSAHTRNMGLW